MNLIRNIVRLTANRYKNARFSTVFLTITLILSMFVISVATSFVAQILQAQDAKKKAMPPHGMAVNFYCEGEEEFKIDALKDMLSVAKSGQGVMIHQVLIHIGKIRNAGLSFVFQQFALIHEYSVYDNIELPLLCRRMPHKKKKQLIHKYASYLGIEDLLKKKVTQISGGQQQRVAIARALVAETDLILADEPTGALDQNTGKELMQVLQDLNKQGKTIILVTHNPEIAEMTGKTLEICDGQCLVKA